MVCNGKRKDGPGDVSALWRRSISPGAGYRTSCQQPVSQQDCAMVGAGCPGLALRDLSLVMD